MQSKCSLDTYAKWLSIVLKDYKSAEGIAFPRESYKSVVREKASQQRFDINNVVKDRKGEDYLYKPAHQVITNLIDVINKSELLTSLAQNKRTSLILQSSN